MIICRPNDFETTLDNDSEILIFSESKINTVTNLVNTCKMRLRKVEGQMMVKEKQNKIREIMSKNVTTMMKQPKIKKRVTIVEEKPERMLSKKMTGKSVGLQLESEEDQNETYY